MNNLFILIFFVVLIIIYSQYIFINKPNNNLEILQGNNPIKDEYEKIINNKSVAVFTNIFTDFNVKDFTQIDEVQKKKDLTDLFKYYHNPVTFTYNFKIEGEDKDSYKPIVRVNSYRFLKVNLTGLKKIIIFNPLQEPNLYITNGYSNLDFWNPNKSAVPNFYKLKYIEVILKEKHMIYIPYGWWYSEFNLSNTYSVSSNSESCFSYLLKK
tara:strand:+ start:213 stop:845 length:633 start_codon:yes stop_codon:yes gene_type:complete